MKRALWLSLSLASWLVAGIAHATEKHALVIGNANYRIGALKNPVNDARMVAQTLRLKQLGFQVKELHNRNLDQMDQEIRQFGASIKPGSVALIYFAGHGMQYRGENYLIPIGITAQYQDQLPRQAISTGFLMESLGNNRNGLNIVILDACRDNPLQKRFRTGTRGLTRIDLTPPNTFTLLSTGPNQVAFDNPRENNGLFTKFLVEQMKQPGLDLSDMTRAIRKQVMAASDSKQVPYSTDSLTRGFCFAGCDSTAQVEAGSNQVAVNHQHGTPVQPAQTVTQTPVTSAGSKRFTVNGDGTVSDSQTGLIWKRCSEGLLGASCQNGSAKTYTWEHAMELKGSHFAGYNDWRLPTKDELQSLLYCSNGTPLQEARIYACGGKNQRNGANFQRPTISTKVFPNSDSWHWSSTPNAYGGAWYVDFNYGVSYGHLDGKDDYLYVRLVRDES